MTKWAERARRGMGTARVCSSMARGAQGAAGPGRKGERPRRMGQAQRETGERNGPGPRRIF